MIKKGKLTIIIEKAKATDENFEMYKSYNYDVHEKSKDSKSGFKNFLCLKALDYTNLENKEKNCKLGLGCYHMNYFIDGKFVAVGVVDIFKECLSSVYFFHDPTWRD